MDATEFSRQFELLTGNQPLSWQTRLYEQHFAIDKNLPPVIDLPTGLGKTMVMAIWLIARMQPDSKLPRRLIYVVDRRTVVDQATDLAKALVENWKEKKSFEGNPPVISTLRGQLADNRQWSRDPSKLAIIIGTVDLIGSGLLFSGYRSSYKRRPLEAGLLGQDSLLVLDEAHLSRPFEKLICAIGSDGAFQKDRQQAVQGMPMQVIRMSATNGTSNDEKELTFTLQDDDANDEIVAARLAAKKRLKVITLGDKEDLNKKLADKAIELAQNSDLVGKRIVVFVRSPDGARQIADRIRTHARPGKTKSNPDPEGLYADSVEVLTGTTRGLERDELVEKLVFKERWLNGELNPADPTNQQSAFLISTSAGEVGFDLNADHLVGDAVPLDSWIQRLGRVNRRGTGDALVILIKEKEPADKTEFDKACIAASSLLTDNMDVSPAALATVQRSLAPEKIDAACSPKPAMVDLTDILLDAWSMTSIAEPMPGRPEVGPWLRGIADDLPQTTIASRHELDEPGFAALELGDIEEWFDTHRILTHETLSVPTSYAGKWFTDRWNELSEPQQSRFADRPIVVDRAGMALITVKSLIGQLSRKGYDSTSVIRNADLIVPASFGGIERGIGLLDYTAPQYPKDGKDAAEPTKAENVRARLTAPDVADISRGWPRLRQVIIKTEDGEPETADIGNGTMPPKPIPFDLDLESDDDRRVRLVSHVPRREKPEVGSQRQTLRQHVDAVRRAVDNILTNIGLPDGVKAEITLAARLAAEFHDHGKNRDRWQRSIGGTATVGTPGWMEQATLEGDGKHQCLGKSGGDIKRDPRGYRHEFGSFRELADAGRAISQDIFDLAMHLIATHHGRGRPHFPKGAFDPDCESRSVELHSESIRRFARLQRKYGWWQLAWLENLLRCADAIASENVEDGEKQDGHPENAK